MDDLIDRIHTRVMDDPCRVSGEIVGASVIRQVKTGVDLLRRIRMLLSDGFRTNCHGQVRGAVNHG